MALAVATVTLGFGASAQAAVTTYPAGGSGFEAAAEGWAGSEEDCSMLSGVQILCGTATAFAPAAGNPGGAIATDVDVTLNLLGLFQGSALWTSPAFTVPAGSSVTGASLHLDRAFAVGGLLNLAPTSQVVATLVDETSGTSTELVSEILDGDDAEYGNTSVPVPVGAVVAGHSYRLTIRTTTTSSLASLGLLGQSNTRYDNVGLVVTTEDDPDDPGGPEDPVGPGAPGAPNGDGGSGGSGGSGGDSPGASPGVRIVRGPVSSSEITRIINSLNLNADVGHGPGGSLVPLARCTIVGTPGRDRIVATNGNDVICGLGGSDLIRGAGGRDVIDGGNGSDRLRGGRGGDLLLGLRGADRLFGDGGADRIGGGAGLDGLFGGPGRDRIYTRDRSRDRINGQGGFDLSRGDRKDRQRGIERVVR